MDQRPGQACEADHLLLGVTKNTIQSQDTLNSHPDFVSFEKDEEAGNVAYYDSSQQLTLVGAFKIAWAMSNGSGRLGLVIHALLIMAAVLGLLGLILYIPFLAIMDLLDWLEGGT